MHDEGELAGIHGINNHASTRRGRRGGSRMKSIQSAADLAINGAAPALT
jgi:hypothetical protein